jgi:hypothetical protein
MEIEGITWFNDAPIDSEPRHEPDAIERRMNEHMDRCGRCSDGLECKRLEDIARTAR